MAFFATVPDHSTVLFPESACYGIDESIFVDDRVDLTFDGNGSTMRTLTTGTPARAFWKIRGGDGVVFTDMTLRGELDVETCPDAISSCSWPRQPTNLEWQHGWHFQGAVNSTLNRVAA
ncbi:MAG TPA: hypothetical protein VNB94_11420, partial [Mycobacteriales bacterium]|nr:hypothetical protein [Mycobacteriales bacterium]